MKRRVAIDLGTCHTLVAQVMASEAEPELLVFEDWAAVFQPEGVAGAVVPSALFVEDARQQRCVLGQRALDQAGADPRHVRLFRAFKRTVATSGYAFAPLIDGMEVNASWVMGAFFRGILQRLQSDQAVIDELVVTVPVQAFETYQDLLRTVARETGVRILRVIDEPTAAAWGSNWRKPGTCVLMVDFGGGTLDLALVRLPGVTPVPVQPGDGSGRADARLGAEVVVKDGILLGGCDIDQWLVDDFCGRHGLNRVVVGDDDALLLGLAERVKVRLSIHYEAEFVYFCSSLLKSCRTLYTRDDFEALLEVRGLYGNVQRLLDKALRQAAEKGLPRSAIEGVVLVGGSVLIPSVQRAIRQNFTATPVRCDRPFDAVVRGALGVPGSDEVVDWLYHAYGVRYWDARQKVHRYERIFEAGHRYPSDTPVELILRASRPNQQVIELVIGELEESLDVSYEVTIHASQATTRRMTRGVARVVTLNDSETTRTIARLDPPGQPGLDRIRVQFRVDDQRQLRLRVDDLLTGQCLLADQAVVALR